MGGGVMLVVLWVLNMFTPGGVNEPRIWFLGKSISVAFKRVEDYSQGLPSWR